MDEAATEAFKAVRKDIHELRSDFRDHVDEDRRDIGQVRDQIKIWAGQLSTIKWLCGAILTAMVAYGAKHW